MCKLTPCCHSSQTDIASVNPRVAPSTFCQKRGTSLQARKHKILEPSGGRGSEKTPSLSLAAATMLQGDCLILFSERVLSLKAMGGSLKIRGL